MERRRDDDLKGECLSARAPAAGSAAVGPGRYRIVRAARLEGCRRVLGLGNRQIDEVRYSLGRDEKRLGLRSQKRPGPPGEGAFYDAFPDRLKQHWCEASEGRDFLDWTRPVDWIVTNPPWSELRAFLRHSLAVADNVVFLAPLTHFTTRSRIALICDAGFGLRRLLLVPTPAEWPASGFQLAAVWLMKGWTGEAEVRELISS